MIPFKSYSRVCRCSSQVYFLYYLPWALLGLLHSWSDLLCYLLSPRFSNKSKSLYPLPLKQLFSLFKGGRAEVRSSFTKKVQYRDPPRNSILFRNMFEMKLSNNILLNRIYAWWATSYILTHFHFLKTKNRKYIKLGLICPSTHLTPLDSDKELSDNSSKTSHPSTHPTVMVTKKEKFCTVN